MPHLSRHMASRANAPVVEYTDVAIVDYQRIEQRAPAAVDSEKNSFGCRNRSCSIGSNSSCSSCSGQRRQPSRSQQQLELAETDATSLHSSRSPPRPPLRPPPPPDVLGVERKPVRLDERLRLEFGLDVDDESRDDDVASSSSPVRPSTDEVVVAAATAGFAVDDLSQGLPKVDTRLRGLASSLSSSVAALSEGQRDAADPPTPGRRWPLTPGRIMEMIHKMKKLFYFLSIAIILSGFAGVITHSVSFSTQSANITNTYKTSWFAAVFAISGLNLLQLLTKAHFSKKSFWFELAVIVLLGCSSFISLVCLGYSQDWPSFAWVFLTYISVAASAIYLLQCKNGSVSDENQTRTVTNKVITAGLYLLKVLFMLIVSLLASGSILSAVASSYPPTGRPISVLFDGANRNGTLQIYCIGNSNISKPTIFIFSSSAHGIVDLYGLQYFLSMTNGTSRRVCIHDPLGFGWSQDPFDGQFTNYEYLYRLMLSSNESMPWHIIGWGGGGSAIMYLANNHTSSVKSVTFVETYPPGIEFSYYGYQNGLGQQAISEYRSAQLSSRIGLAQLILSMAIPWGLMGLFVPISPQHEGYYPPERWSEFRVQMWKSKVWISQYQGLRHLQMTSDSQDPLIAFAPLSSQIPVFGVYCNATVACEAQGQNGQDCTQLTYYSTKKFSMIQEINTDAMIAVNSDVDCNLNLPVQKPLFTASSILKLYSGIEV